MITWRPERLAPYVEKMVWIGNGSAEPFIVYPDIHHVMGIQNIGHMTIVNDGQQQLLDSAGLTGIHHNQKLFQASASLSSVLIYFKPAALYRWSLCSPREIAARSVSLIDLGKPVSAWNRVLDPRLAANPREWLVVIEELLWRMFADTETDRWAVWAIDQIQSTRGIIRIGQLAEEAVLSRRQFERRFIERIGVSAKSLAQIVKFQHALQTLKADNRPSALTHLAHEANYYDQAHFIREFRKKSGVTPGQLRDF
ncbi:AraC family transcriptional regulator [Paenibacillus sp. HB172176]|uniref:helix-turn-helix domain-containing protein n=1 Tax=Paenibacillus sp. HB172176 TaxID=2493690 RepID=UPI00143BEC72|nr:AraC family transcriptional regulator [Paenibacillus sp. HB172176]